MDRPDLLAMSLRHELMLMLESIVDQGSAIDGGGGMGSEDIWIKVGGVKFRIQIHWPEGNGNGD